MDLALWLLLGVAQATTVAAPIPPADTTSAATPDPATAATASSLRIPAGSPVQLQLLDDVGSRGKRGDRFRIRLSEPLLQGDTVVVPAGAEGIGEITHASRAGMGGRPGELLLAARYLVIDGRQVRLRAFHLGGSGSDRIGGAVALAFATGPFALFLHGGEIRIPAGTTGNAKLAEDLVVAPPLPPVSFHNVP